MPLPRLAELFVKKCTEPLRRPSDLVGAMAPKFDDTVTRAIDRSGGSPSVRPRSPHGAPRRARVVRALIGVLRDGRIANYVILRADS
jgi:hypothetical protein